MQLGTGHDVSVGDLMELVEELCGTQLVVEQEAERVRPEKSEVDRLVSSPAMVRELTGWEPAVALREGLARTIEWIERNLDRYRVNQYVI